ncbi:MAG: hypothetical protein HQM06_13865 [Magnetococcales bacterium]|nr:hypothetical protein [Magnetococcales bacterium]
MDPLAIIPILSTGGPTALFTVALILIYFLFNRINKLNDKIDALAKAQVEYQVAHANDHPGKSDFAEIREAIRKHEQRMEAVLTRIFDKLDESRDKCGRDCLAAEISRDCRAMHMVGQGQK